MASNLDLFRQTRFKFSIFTKKNLRVQTVQNNSWHLLKCWVRINLRQKSFWSGSPSVKKKKRIYRNNFTIVYIYYNIKGGSAPLYVAWKGEVVFLGELACHKLRTEFRTNLRCSFIGDTLWRYLYKMTLR